MDYFICYDISDSKRRYKIRKLIENYGVRVQKSAFFCSLEEDIKQILVSNILHNLNDKEDSIIFYPVQGNFSNSSILNRNTFDISHAKIY